MVISPISFLSYPLYHSASYPLQGRYFMAHGYPYLYLFCLRRRSLVYDDRGCVQLTFGNHTWSAGKVSSHFEYLENQLNDFNVTK